MREEVIERCLNDLILLCKAAGIELIPSGKLFEESRLAEMSYRSLLIWKDGKHYIFYNDKLPKREKICVAIAREIGHVVLGHMLSDEWLTVRRDEAREAANNFAYELIGKITAYEKNKQGCEPCL